MFPSRFRNTETCDFVLSEFFLITSIRLIRVTVCLSSSFNFSLMFVNSKTDYEKIGGLATD